MISTPTVPSILRPTVRHHLQLSLLFFNTLKSISKLQVQMVNDSKFGLSSGAEQQRRKEQASSAVPESGECFRENQCPASSQSTTAL